tara:strand:+ start:3782 stop:4129 length:348 start_codon:yes stop_codon:yes gene_type:complete
MFWFGFFAFILGCSLFWYGLPDFLKQFIIRILKLPFNKYLGNSVEREENEQSRHISQSVKDKVWRRDQGKCVECGSSNRLEFDHIIPFAKGGANTYRNIQLLCEKCNRSKSDKIG